MWIFALFELFFVVLGIVFLCGKGSFLIAGYNTMTPQEKAEWDEKALCKAVGVMMFVIAAWFTVIWLSSWLHNYILLTVGILSFIVAVIGYAVYINTSNKFKRK